VAHCYARRVADIPAQWHGTWHGYVKSRCRCGDCKRWQSERTARWREAQRDQPQDQIPHGLGGYANYACRCPVCRAAKSAANAADHAARVARTA